MEQQSGQTSADCVRTEESSIYTYRALFNPIHGVDEDISEFISRFTACGSLRFTKFAEIWKRERFFEIIYGRRHQAGLYDILGCIFHRLVDVILPKAEKKQIERICALYMLYAFYGKQPIKHQVRIRVCPESWKAILQLATEARDEGHLDVYYIFRQLCALSAFAFCATRQILYPGAPLFDSPQTHQEPRVDEGPTTMRRERSLRRVSVEEDGHRLDAYLHVLQLQGTSRTSLSDALNSLDASLMRYTEAKRALNPPTNENLHAVQRREEEAGSGEESDEAEEFLPGLNFITHPGSLNKVFATLKKLDTVEQEYLPIKKEPTGTEIPDNEDGGTAEPSDYQLFSDLMLESIPPEDPVTDQIVETCSTFTPRKRRLRGCSISSKKNTVSSPSSSILEEEVDEVSDIGERRRLLRQPSTWSKELDAQLKAVRTLGHHIDRRRPQRRKVLKRRANRRSS